MPSPRKQKTKMAMRHGELSGTMSQRERQAIRRLNYSNASEISAILSNPSQETIRWAKSGALNQVILSKGSLEDLRAIHSLGARFHDARWDNASRIYDWKEKDAAEWLSLLFDRGWSGKGGSPREPLLEVAEDHPNLIEMWKKHAPQAWHTRHNWLSGGFNVDQNLTPERVKAYYAVGGSHAGAHKLNLNDWFAVTRDPNQFVNVLKTIKSVLKEEKQRRRVRGEPPYREWPWSRTVESAMKNACIPAIEWLFDEFGAPAQSQMIEWIAASRNPLALLEHGQAHNWRLPHPQSDGASDLVNAILDANWIATGKKPSILSSRGKETLEYLLENGYRVNLGAHTSIFDDPDFPENLAASFQAAQLQNTCITHSVITAAPARRRL